MAKLDDIEHWAKSAKIKLEFANEVAGGARVGTEMAIDVLNEVPNLIKRIRDLEDLIERYEQD